MPRPTRRYTDVLARAALRHPALDPANLWYRPELAAWVAERRDEYRNSGLPPDVALMRAVMLLEQE